MAESFEKPSSAQPWRNKGSCIYNYSEMVEKKPASGAERRCEVNWHPSKTGTKRFGWSGTGPEA